MSNSFFEKSTKIADRFIQSVLFVDDEIYSDNEDKRHYLDAYELVRAFSKSKKLCALNNPKREEDFDDIIEVAKKTDISVLDWKMDLQKSDAEGDEEEVDVEEDDPRGSFTLKLIEALLTDKDISGTFRLILIYTGETILDEILDKIHSHFKAHGLYKISDNAIGKLNFKIVVAGKPYLKSHFKHAKERKRWIVEYSEIPKFLLDEFTKMTEGLISNFSLESLSTIRNNTYRILQLFNKKMDTAYLGHKVLLPTQEDSEDLLVDLMKDSLGDLLHYCEISKTLDADTIKLWLSENIVTKKIHFLDKKAKNFKDEEGKDLNLKCVLTEKLIWELVFGEDSDVSIRFKNAFKNTDGFKRLNKSQKTEFLKYIQINSSSLFSLDQDDYEELDLRFANLTHHKHLFKPSKYPPKLSLGVVLKGTLNGDIYWVCIQQKCDSVRLKNG
ncbi:MAG: response regulator receiver domain, partial [Candidatus Babeliales bacterium]